MHEFSTHGHYQNIKLGYFDRDSRIIELIKLTAELNEVLVGSGYTVGIYECATYKLLFIFQAISLDSRRLDSSVGRAPDCCGGRGFKSQTGPTLRVLK